MDFGILIILGLAWAIGTPIVALVALTKANRLDREVQALRSASGSIAPATTQPSATSTPLVQKPASETRPTSKGRAWSGNTTDPGTPANTPPQTAAAKVAAPATTGKSTPPPPPVSPTPRPDRMGPLKAWLAANWIAVGAAVSLAFAGIYLVIYGIEQGFITPAVRVIMAAILGGTLIGAGEWLRRRTPRFPDDIVPAILAGAGLVTLYGTVAAADLLYGFLSETGALILLVCVATISLALGGRHAMFLSAFGLIGAAFAPWIVGGTPQSDLMMPAYYGALAIIGVALAWFRGWHVLTPLAGALALGLGFLPAQAGSSGNWPALGLFVVIGTFMWLGALIHPLAPDRLVAKAADPARAWERSVPLFTTLIVLAVTHLAFIVVSLDLAELALTGGLLLAATALAMIVQERKKLLAELPALPLISALLLVLGHAAQDGPGWSAITLLLIASLMAIIYATRTMARGGNVAWAFWAALITGGSFGALEYATRPAETLGAYPWSLALMGAAAIATFGATWAKTITGRLEASGLYTIAAGGLIALALTVTFDAAALTIALSITLVLAAILNLRLRLPYVAEASALAVGGLAVRLVLYPGLDWGWSASWLQLALAYGGTIAAFAAITLLTRRAEKPTLRDTAMVGLGILVPATFCLVLFRIEAGPAAVFPGPSHWSMALAGMAIFASGLGLRPRQMASDFGTNLRLGACLIITAPGVLTVLAAATMFSPLVAPGELVRGPILLNSLAVTYLAPATLFFLAIRILPAAKPPNTDLFRIGLGGLSLVLTLAWIFLTARHVWQGPAMASAPILPGEQTTYTVLMVMLGAATIWISTLVQANLRDLVRRAGLIVIGLTMAKAMLIDASGLEGLARVLSFLILGLVLTALAWADRRLGGRNTQT